MTDGSLPASTNGVVSMGVLAGRPGEHLQKLQHVAPRAPRSLSLPEYRPAPRAGVLEDRRSLKSVDSGIPTLEVGNPEPVPCSVVHVKQSEAEAAAERACRSACPLPSCATPAPPSTERGPGVRKSSTFPRTGYDAVRLDSPTSRALGRSDQASVCSVSSLGTELSATLSVSNEDLVDLVVTSSSSAIVTLENDDDPQLTDVTLSCAGETRDLHPQGSVAGAEAGSKPRTLGPLSSLFPR
ncbi:PREDICTED: TBC1 domain family member 14-like [Condylura cristata]|uniref:TBC1 domain family member 14-like n=1 Tax=Condylura cristata TaxID=143302 RepID=UPI0006428F8D|nr:PREDICTED: TBC1 domain family member 14-like [Condylura cristata]